MKKFVSLLLSAVIIASMVPLAVSANAAPTDSKVTADNPISETQPQTETQVQTQPETTQAPTQEPTSISVITPAKPKNFIEKTTTENSITIRWDKVQYATSYVISRADEGSDGKMGSYSVIKTIDNVEYNSYKNTVNIKPGKLYKYKVVAKRDANGIITTSEAATLTTMSNPTNVSSLKVSKRTKDYITIKWSKHSQASNYVVQRSVEDDNGKFSSFKTIKTTAKTTTSLKNTGLKSGYIYKYRVKVKRTKSSVSKTSSGANVKTVTSPAAPKTLVNKKATAKSIKVSWSKVNKATKYELYRKTGKGKYKKVKTTASTSYTDKKVKIGKKYKYKVRAYRKVDKKKYYSSYTTALSTTTAVKSVKGVTVKSYLRRGLFSWKAVKGASGYSISVKKSNGQWKNEGSTKYRNFLTKKLKVGKTYTYRIRSYKKSGGQKIYGKSKVFNVNVKNTAYGKTVSGTWVEVCIETQQMYMYVNNKLYCSTPVITGYAYNSRRTTPGFHKVLSKKSPANLSGSYGGSSWNVTVSYWLGFTGDGQGIHDASWQSNFGGELYKLSSRGSHGCVNTPRSAVAKIYSKAYVGMPVVVY